MNAEPCAPCMTAEGTQAQLPQTIASQIEVLREQRLSAYAEQAFQVKRGGPSQTELERSVDDLLDSLSIMHHLDQLAAFVARGGELTVDADRLFVAEYEETFLRLVSQYKGKRKSSANVSTPFLSSFPMPID